MKKITNKKFQFIESVDPNLTEVIVTFNYDDQIKRHYIFLRKVKGKSNTEYLKEAEKQFEVDLKNKKIVSLKSKRGGSIKGSSRGMKVAVVALSVTTLAFAGLFAWKLLTNPGDTPFTPKEITYEEAQEWLDNHYTYNLQLKIQSGDFSWDYSKSVEDSENPGAFFEFGCPFLVSYLMDPGNVGTTFTPIEMTENRVVDNYHYDGITGSLIYLKSTNSKMLKEEIKEHAPDEETDPKPTKCWIAEDGLHVSYKRCDKIGSGMIKINMIETNVYDEDGIPTKFDVVLDKEAINFPGVPQYGIPAFKGELTGKVTASYNISELEKACCWIDRHHDDSEIKRDIETEDYVWDFSQSEGEGVDDLICTFLSSTIGQPITETKGQKLGVIPQTTVVAALTYATFKNRYTNKNYAAFEMKKDELIVSYNETATGGDLFGYRYNTLQIIDNKCFQIAQTISCDHSSSKTNPGIIITGYLKLTLNFTNE